MDMLGFYRMCCDFGYSADVIDADMIAEGRLSDYAALIIPENDCYDFDINDAAENAVREWVDNGGIIISSPFDRLCERVFGIHGEEFCGSQIYYGEGGIVKSDRFEYFTDGEPFIKYCADAYAGPTDPDKTAAVVHTFGKGKIYSLGFAYGYSYCAKIAPHVPLSQKNNELYPVQMMKRNIVDDIFKNHGIGKCIVNGRNIETAEFDGCVIIINHNSQPVPVEIEGEKIFQYDTDGCTLMPRSAVYVKIKQN